jgi:opacity protein-like surface antigen
MENKNHNLEDFFRKKLNDPSESEGAWDRPDPDVWEQAQLQIRDFQKRGGFFIKNLNWAILLLFLLSTAGFIWHLLDENKALKEALKIQNELAVQASEKNEITETKRTQGQADLQPLQKTKNNIPKNQTAPNNQVLISPKVGKQLKSGHQKLKNSIPFTDLNESMWEEKIDFQINNEETRIYKNVPFLHQKQMPLELLAAHKLNLMPLSTPIKKSQRKYEVGYEYSFPSIKIPSKEGKLASDEKLSTLKSTNHLSPAQGVYFAYAPKQNLFIRTGIRRATAKMERNWKIVDDYNKSGEYIKPNGGVGNDIDLSLRTPYGEQQGDVQLEIPDGTELSSDDLILLFLSDFQEFTLYQIPVGLEYFHGKRKLQWHFQGGFQWNRMTFGDYTLIANAEAKNKELSVSKVDINDKSGVSKNFLGLYAGIGINYAFTDHWHARATLGYDYSFIQNKSKEFSSSDFVGNAVKFGLNYRF